MGKVSLKVEMSSQGGLVKITGSPAALELVKEALDRAESSAQGVATVSRRRGIPCVIKVVRT